MTLRKIMNNNTCILKFKFIPAPDLKYTQQIPLINNTVFPSISCSYIMKYYVLDTYVQVFYKCFIFSLQNIFFLHFNYFIQIFIQICLINT